SPAGRAPDTLGEMLAETADATRESSRGGARRRPGVVVAFSGSSAMSLVLAVDEEPLTIGRAGQAGSLLSDHLLPRSPCSPGATAAWSAGGGVRDLGSRNGPFVGGDQVPGEVTVESPRIIRAADTIVIPCLDVTGFQPVALQDGVVVGCRMHDALVAVDRAAA